MQDTQAFPFSLTPYGQAINRAVPGRSESVPGHNTFSWVTEARQCLPGPWGNSGLSVHICFFSVCHCHPAWGPEFDCATSVPGCSWWPAPHQGHHFPLPAWSFGSLFCVTPKQRVQQEEKRVIEIMQGVLSSLFTCRGAK